MGTVDRRLRGALLVAVSFVLALPTVACGAATYGGAGHPLTVPELKYRLIDQVGRPLFCGPPVLRFPPPAEVHQEVTALKSQDPATFSAILARLHLSANPLTTDQERSILDQADILNHLTLLTQGQLDAFDYIASRSTPEHVTGTIDSTGSITLARHDPVTYPGAGGCPICLAAQDRIATPDGAVPITLLKAGMTVWTLDAAGRRIAAPVLRVGHVHAPIGHHVVQLVLADGRTVEASPGHPTADGRRVGDLVSGDLLDGSRVIAIHPLPYAGDTWDLLPAGPTHDYWADGVLLSSTLAAASASS